LSAVRKLSDLEEIICPKYCKLIEVKTKMHEVADFVCDTLNNGVDPDSEEFLKKLEMLRRENKRPMRSFFDYNPAKQDSNCGLTSRIINKLRLYTRRDQGGYFYKIIDA